MRYPYRSETMAQAAQRLVSTQTPPARPPTAKPRNRVLMRSAIASAVLSSVMGCATVESDAAKAWKIEPVFNVTHAVQSSQAHYTMGRYYDGSLQWDKSIEAYRRAIAADANNIEAYNALGVALAQRGRYMAAETTLRQAVAIAPALTHVRSNLGYVLLLAGKPGAAALELQAAVEQDSTNITARENLRDALAQSDSAQRNAAATTPGTAKQPAANKVATASHALVVTDKVPVEVGGVMLNVNVPSTISVPAPVMVAEVPAPFTASVSLPVPFHAWSAAAGRSVATASRPALPAVATTQPRAADPPNITSLEKRVAGVGVAAPAMAPDLGTPTVALRSPSAREKAPRVEISNGNGVAGMATHTARWLATQGVQAHRVTNQRRFVQQQTVIQYRSGHEEAARRVARSLPGHVKVALAPTQGLRNDVRVVLGRDWARTAACLERNTCQPAATSVAAASDR